MARIRTVKPEFFRHEALQDLESEHPGTHVMLVFAALWGHCDKEGRFLWRPRSLKLDILPFLDFDLSASLVLLREAGLIRQYEIDGVLYGEVPTFKDHQRISGKEAQEPAKYPEPREYLEGKQPGQNGEATEKQPGRQEGKGREQEREGNGYTARAALESEFEVWYARYPRKDARAKALPAYVKARKKTDAATLLAALERYTLSKPAYQDWAMPATWLNQERWNDQGATAGADPRTNPDYWRTDDDDPGTVSQAH